MKTICLRFSDVFAPEQGTIKLHQDVIKKYGFVWYGKTRNKISAKLLQEILTEGPVKIILLKASSNERY